MRRVRSALKGIGLRVLIAIGAGVLFGVLDLWIYQLSVRGFLAGLAAGVAYSLVVVFLSAAEGHHALTVSGARGNKAAGAQIRCPSPSRREKALDCGCS